MAMIYLVWGPLVGGREKPWGFAAIAIDRHRLRRIANGLGITQRALYFALVTHAVNGGTKGHIHRTRLATAYTRLGADRSDTDDDFFRVRNVDVRFRPMDDFAAYARHVEETIQRTEAEGKTGFQSLLNGMFRILRRINAIIPALPPTPHVALERGRRCDPDPGPAASHGGHHDRGFPRAHLVGRVPSGRKPDHVFARGGRSWRSALRWRSG